MFTIATLFCFLSPAYHYRLLIFWKFYSQPQIDTVESVLFFPLFKKSLFLILLSVLRFHSIYEAYFFSWVLLTCLSRKLSYSLIPDQMWGGWLGALPHSWNPLTSCSLEDFMQWFTDPAAQGSGEGKPGSCTNCRLLLWWWSCWIRSQPSAFRF